MPICKNPECGKELPENQIYCNEQCLKRYLELKKQPAKATRIREEPNPSQSSKGKPELSLEYVLTNPVYQRGAGYRAEKLKAIDTARQQGNSDEQIMKYLLRGGLTKQTAKVMMQDSREAYDL